MESPRHPAQSSASILFCEIYTRSVVQSRLSLLITVNQWESACWSYGKCLALRLLSCSLSIEKLPDHRLGSWMSSRARACGSPFKDRKGSGRFMQEICVLRSVSKFLPDALECPDSATL